LSLRQICDTVYVILVDQLVARAVSERQVTATMAAAGAKDDSGKPVKLTDPEEERRQFDRRLNAPLGIERAREAILREFAS
jgi:hypothetical protein